ncbi:MAG TPA: hypothetical protein VGI45_10435 [Terracidiphilus sp.]|jgi:dipeptidyl aminopeptidase/acylaminoacyl peptidase
MRLVRNISMVVSFVSCLVFSTSARAAAEKQGRQSDEALKRPVTVADAIAMTQFDDPSYNVGRLAGHRVAQFSPDGKQFLILVKKGDVQNNTNKYSLLLFKAEEALRSPRAEVLVSFSSNSNRPGIQQSRWIDNRTVAFLAENPGEVQQLYIVDCRTKRVTKLTNHATSVVSFAMSADRSRVYFLASQRLVPLFDEQTARAGFVVSNQTLVDLIAGERRFASDRYCDLFVRKRGAPGEVRIKTQDEIVSDSISLSPNGRYLLLKAGVGQIPEIWGNYEDAWLRLITRGTSSFQNHPLIFRYDVFDTETEQLYALMNAPINRGHAGFAWSPDSRSIVMSEIYLPLTGCEERDRALRQSQKFVAEIKIPSRVIVPITSKKLRLLRWDSRTNAVLFEPLESLSGEVSSRKLIAFRRLATGWQSVPATESETGPDENLDVLLEEDMNTPPRFFAENVRSGQKTLILDLNPQFKDLRFGHVDDITFEATDGHTVKAGLYWPVDYVRGNKYPLVIQTHAWNAHKFLIDGPWPSAFAAQPLAGRGIFVLQFEEDLSKISTPAEAPEEMAAYEGGIDYLNRHGLIDTANVGIIGFSRTGFGVKYALTHSKYHFKAATIADGSDEGYFGYMSILTSIPIHLPDMEGVNGGAPFGDNLLSWLKNSPGFNLDKVGAAVREEAYGPLSLFFEWEWFAGLSRLHKPMELIYMPDAPHLLTKPSERMISQQGNVDWFCFWLKDEENSDPSKREQYVRWRRMRDESKGN